ncbi:calcofluor white hypersensitive protein [Apiospora arundinis]
MLLRTIADAGLPTRGKVHLHYNGAAVAITGGPSLLSLYAEPAEYLGEDEQLGLPKLLETGSEAQYSLLRQWIRECDKSHKMCRRTDNTGVPAMPTRVIDLGTPLRLVDTGSIPKAHYAALSHRWEEGNLYVCPAIDDFHRDVELAELNQRGWVLQERALSRRSVHFTSTQMYWECGRGVHCETMARLDNAKAAFIGDANFPKSGLEYYRDGRQVLVQDLYERYSGLAFTNPEDRAVAILGLQKRLARAFNTRAAYGFLAEYFTRGLLWQRRGGTDGEEGSQGSLATSAHMGRIPWNANSSGTPPSWSWLSKSGPIRYMVAKFAKIEWASTTDFTHPFITRPKEEGQDEDVSVIRGLAREVKLPKDELLSLIDFDTEPELDVKGLRCVIIGRDKVEPHAMTMARQYVLVIRPVRNGATGTYERVGFGSLWMRHMSEGIWVTIR